MKATHVDIEKAATKAATKHSLLQTALGAIEKRSDLLNTLMLTARDHAFILAVTDSDDDAVCTSLRLAAQAAGAMFALATASKGTEVEVPLGERTLRMTATGPANWAHAANWILGFHLAAIVRDQATLDTLAHVPLAVLQAAPGVSVLPAILSWVETLQAFWTDSEDTGKRVLATLRATDSSVVPADMQAYVRHVLVPEVEMLYRFLQRDLAAFRTALEKALEGHAAYWGTKQRDYDSAGFLALAPLSIASFAHDSDVAIDVESAYLPPRLYTGDCAEE